MGEQFPGQSVPVQAIEPRVRLDLLPRQALCLILRRRGAGREPNQPPPPRPTHPLVERGGAGRDLALPPWEKLASTQKKGEEHKWG